MTEPSLDLDKPNAVGTLDRLTTNVALSLIAVVPTFFACIFRPWRLATLIRQDDPEGRCGMLLAPGAFFPLSLLVSMIAGALLTTPEIASNNGAYLGPGLALSIQSAVSEGDVWKTIAIIMPIYGVAVLVGTAGSILKYWTHGDWTLRVSLRAVFYVAGAFVSWVILSTAAIDLIRVSTGNTELVNLLLSLVGLPSIGGMAWMYFWFLRNDGAISRVRSGILSGAMLVLTILSVIGVFLAVAI
jgi:hypothetical protein